MCASGVLVCLLEYVVWLVEEEKLREEDISCIEVRRDSNEQYGT